MADESSLPPSSPNAGGNNSWSNPQVVIALITGVVSILVTLIGVLPNLIGADDPTATPTPVAVVVTATQLPPTPTAETQSVANVSQTTVSTAEPTAAVRPQNRQRLQRNQRQHSRQRPTSS